jgi:hypothetical protein
MRAVRRRGRADDLVGHRRVTARSGPAATATATTTAAESAAVSGDARHGAVERALDQFRLQCVQEELVVRRLANGFSLCAAAARRRCSAARLSSARDSGNHGEAPMACVSSTWCSSMATTRPA